MDNNPERRHNYDNTLEAANRHISEKSMMEERARCLKAVDDEPEWSEKTPEHYGVLEKMFKANLIKETKKNIRKRIEHYDGGKD